jgi:hypothetical protein
MDLKGVGRGVTSPDIDYIIGRLRRLQVTATVRNAENETIGEMHDRHEHDLPGNAKWVWWIDPDN